MEDAGPGGAARWAVLAMTLLHSFLLGGTVFGWPSLVVLLEREGQYSELCANPDAQEECQEQALKFLSIFQFGFFPLFGARLLFGIMLDRLGPRITVLVGTACVTVGVFLFAFSDSQTFDAFIPAFFLMGFGSPAPHVASIHVSNLFPTRARSVVTLYSANFSLSGAVFLLFLWISESSLHATVRQLFLAYGVILCAVLVSVPMVQPWTAYKRGDRVAWSWRRFAMRLVPAATVGLPPAPSSTPSVTPTAAPAAAEDRVGLLAESDDAPDEGNPLAVVPVLEPFKIDDGQAAPARPTKVPLKERTLWRQLASAECVAVALYLVALNSDLQFYVASVRAQTVLLGDSAESGYLYTKMFIVFGAIGFVAFPLISYTLERRGFPASFLTVAVLIGLSNVIALVPSLPAQYVTFLFWSTGRFALFAAYFAYLPEAFGFRYFGTVNGVLSVLLATSALLPYPLTLLVIDVLQGQYWPINVAFLVVCLVAGVAYPLWLRRRDRASRPPATALGSG